MSESVIIKMHRPEYVLSTLESVDFKASNEDGSKGDIKMLFKTGEYYEDDPDFPDAPRYREGSVECFDYGYYWDIGKIVKKWRDKIRKNRRTK